MGRSHERIGQGSGERKISARALHPTAWGQDSKPREAKVEQTQGSNAHPDLVIVRQPDGNVGLGKLQAQGKSKTDKSVESQKQNRDISHQRGNITNHERFARAYKGNPYPEDYNRHKQEIHAKLNDLEKKYKELKEIDRKLGKHFNNLWFKSILGKDNKKKIDKREIEFKKSREKLRETIDRLENTVQGNPKGYACVSIGDWIKLHPQDKKEFQERIDRIKPGDPKPGEKQTSRQKRFEEQEAIRDRQMEADRASDRMKHIEKVNKEIDISEGKFRNMIKEYKKQIDKISDGNEIFQKSDDHTAKISDEKHKIENLRYGAARGLPDLQKRCDNLIREFKEYQKELHDKMTKKFGPTWTMRHVRR